MSVSGMKKQLHKASQLLNERLMGAEGTKMDDDFLKMEKSVEVLQALLVELLSRTTEFLQPHPGARAKLSVLNTMSRIRGHGGGAGYPQTESMLGDCMSHYGRELGPASEFGGALTEAGGALQEVAQARDALGVDIKRTFIDPLEQLQNTELKEIRFQLKKLNGRRLDFDYKRRRRGKVPAEEVQRAWDKFLLSKELAERSMFVLLQSDVDQLSRLAALVAAQLDFHRNAHRILLGLHGNLQARLTAASNRPERSFRPKKIRVRSEHNGSFTFHRQPAITPVVHHRQPAITPVVHHRQPAITPVVHHRQPAITPVVPSADSNLILDQPCCRALYSFRPSHAGELIFSEGDIIVLTNQVDSNWFEGSLAGQSGLFPVCYVDILVPLPLP